MLREMNYHQAVFNLCMLICCSICSYSYSQTVNLCGQAEILNNWFKLHPEDKIKFDLLQQEQEAAQTTLFTGKSSSAQAALVPTYTIPVVFHILHLGGIENISDAQILDEMAVLNRSYQKLNGDTINVVPSYTNNIANIQFEFRLASIDPNGNCTNGIIRHYTPKTDWDANDFNAFTYTWPPNKYLNIYIVRSINIAPAYTFLPGTNPSPNTDVIVCQHNICGSIGTSNVANSWAITHEAAHWFNIPHIWGFTNQPGVSCGDDGVSDTPITKGFTSCNLANASICTPPIIENMQNYMDYSPCKLMFTNGQKARMHACINNTINNRNNLSTPGNLLATGITTTTTNCLPQLEIAAMPSATLCAGKSLILNSYTCNANPTSYSWSATNNALISNTSLPNPTFTFSTVGNSTVTCVVANANGSASASIVISALANTAQVSNTYPESFESVSLPQNWSVTNSTLSAVSWSITNTASSHGNQSIYIAAENAPGASVSLLQTPSYDFLNNQGSVFTFKYAYALFSNTHKDVFKVQASKDCGGTWKDIYVPSMASFANGSGGVTSSVFVPFSFDWKTYNITTHPNFSSFLNEAQVILRFYFKEDSAGFGNRIYLDQINFESPVGINEFTKSVSLSLHPNPSSGEFNLGFTMSESKKVKITILTASGSIVGEQLEMLVDTRRHEIILNAQKKLAAGIYFVEIGFNDLKAVKKIIID